MQGNAILCALAKIQKMKLSSLNILLWITIKKKQILGVSIDNRLTFSSHIIEFCEKASQKISALSKISSQPNDSAKKKILCNAVVKSYFNYCPLVWMFCPRTSNKVHERALRVILDDDLIYFESLLQQ